MAYSFSSYQTRCECAAKHFLQSVIVIDNQAEFYEGEWKRSLESNNSDHPLAKKKLSRRPTAGLSKEQTHRATIPIKGSVNESLHRASMSESDGDKSHVLHAWTLTEKLADEGILCTVYRPDDHQVNNTQHTEADDAASHPVVTRSVNMAKLADIVVLDWELGSATKENKGTWKAREIIKAILDKDNEKKGRQRLITIYTATPDLNGVFSDVVEDIGSIVYVQGKLKQNKKNLSLSNKTTRVVLLNKDTKNTESKSNTTVSEECLPLRLIKEFVKLNCGLFPTIALHSIASIRETTHHILSTFNSELDPALVSHRSLLPDPQHSEEFALDLIAGELRSVLSLNQIGEKYAGIRAHKDWIAGRLKKRKLFSLNKHISIKRDEAFELVSVGSDQFDMVWRAAAIRWVDETWDSKQKFKHRNIPGKLSKTTLKKLIRNLSLKDLRKQTDALPLDFKQLTGLFAENQSKGNEVNHKFSRLTSLKRERFGARYLPEGWLPKLTQGTIIREIRADNSLSNEFLLCIQPRCDCDRLKGETEFPFLKMTTKEIPSAIKQHLIVKCPDKLGSDPTNIMLWLYPLPSRQKMLPFDPSTSSGNFVQAHFERDIFVFISNSNRYEWIADMKNFMAQKICDQLSGRQGSVGLDEYEWLRRISNT